MSKHYVHNLEKSTEVMTAMDESEISPSNHTVLVVGAYLKIETDKPILLLNQTVSLITN